jgi:hypothetical protein
MSQSFSADLDVEQTEQTRLLSNSATKMDEHDIRVAYQAMGQETSQMNADKMDVDKMDADTMDADEMVIEAPRVTTRSVDEDYSEFDIE